MSGENPNPLPKSKCPQCGYVTDAAVNFADESVQPKPGDFSVCMYCGMIGVYTENLTVRTAKPNDFAKLDKDVAAELMKTQRAVLKLDLPAKRN